MMQKRFSDFLANWAARLRGTAGWRSSDDPRGDATTMPAAHAEPARHAPAPAAHARRAQPDWPPGWAALRARHAYLAPLSAEEAHRLMALCAEFIAAKQFSAAGGHELSDDMIQSIAVQACLPVLELGLAAYPVFSEIIVYPGEFLVEREFVDDAGVVHSEHAPLAGEAWDGGPVVLSWEDVEGAVNNPDAGNVVIHEFAHKLDMTNGEVDGLPHFWRTLHAGLEPAAWCAAFESAWQDFTVRLERLEDSLPADVDPESEEGWLWYATLPLDPYAATDPGEFFSVCAEVFFVDPERLADSYPQVYDLLRRYFRQDPAARLRSSAPPRS